MATKIKIKIVDPDGPIKISLPAIPISFINGMLSISLRFKNIGLKYSDSSSEETRAFLESLDSRDIKEALKEFRLELKKYEAFDLVYITDKKGTKVKISIL